MASKAMVRHDPVAAIQQRGQESLARTQSVEELVPVLKKHFGPALKIDGRGDVALALAWFVKEAQVDPFMELEFLHQRPYLNAQFYINRAAQHADYDGHDQHTVSAAHLNLVRSQAAEAEADGDQEDARKLRREARRIERWMLDLDIQAGEVGCVTEVYRKSRPGRPIVDGKKIPAPEKRQSAAKSHPMETLRTRSLRRALRAAFEQRQIDMPVQLEQQLHRRWEGTEEMPHPSGEIVVGDGEPSRALTPPTGEGEEMQSEEIKDRHRAYFATMRDLGKTGRDSKKRSAWQQSIGLPASTKDWKVADYDLAIDKLIEPVRAQTKDIAAGLGVDVEQVALDVLGKATPERASDWKAMRDELRTRAAKITESAAAEPELLSEPEPGEEVESL